MNTTLLHQLVSIMILARHGKAVAAKGLPDADRKLDELGVKQAKALESEIRTFEPKVALSSPLSRVIETIQHATANNSSIHGIRLVQELSCSDDPQDPLTTMWLKLGNVPISRYFDHELGKNLKIWGRTALRAVIRELQDGGSNQNVLIGGHALLQNALLWAIAEQLEGGLVSGWEHLYEMAETPLSEGEAFVVILKNDGVKYTEHLRPKVS